MAFHKLETAISGLWIIEPDVFPDERGYFMEMWNHSHFSAIGLELVFVQDNLSYSHKGTLRGLHYQVPPFAQGKLVTVLKGRALDVAVDIRKGSPTFGKHIAIELSSENHRMFFIPPGFAHGFAVLSDDCLFHYKCTSFYNKSAEMGLMWNDPDLCIDWKTESPVVSGKDRENTTIKALISPFEY